MTFWILTVFLTVGVTTVLGLVLVRTRPDDEAPAAYDLRVYRQQLKDVDRDLSRGVIAAEDAERVKTEVSRRILSADAQLQDSATSDVQPKRLTTLIATLSALVLLVGSYALYQKIGAPGIGDLPLEQRIEQAAIDRAERISQQEAEARIPPVPQPEVEEGYAALIERLRNTVEQRPGDVEGHSLLARHEANLGNFKAAYAAKAKEIELLTSEAGAQHHAEHAEMMILSAGGYVSPEAEAALDRALRLDPTHGPARYYWGSMLAQIGRPDLAFRMWDQTLRRSPPNAPWALAIRGQIEEMAFRAGVRYDLPPLPEAPPATPVAPGPDADQVAAAQDMSADERAEMIRGMVDGLSDRLATEGGTPEEWARLINALGVLGEADRAQAVYDEAKTVFRTNPQGLAMILDAGARAGVSR